MIRVGNIINAFIQYIDVYIFKGAYVNGIWTNSGTISKVQIRGSVQEMNGKFLKMLPEGTREEETRLVFSQDSLPIDNEVSPGNNDIRFVISGETFRLIENKKWEGDYSVYILQQLRAINDIPTV